MLIDRARYFWTLGIVFAFASACGVKAKKNDETLLPENPRDDSYADEYFVEDPDCQVGTSAIMGSRLVDSTFYGLHQRASCEYDGSKINCPGESELVKAAMYLRLCRQIENLNRVSVEGVAARGMSGLDTAYGFYQGLGNKSPSLMRTGLIVLPKVEKHIVIKSGKNAGKSVTKIVTDNLAYTPSYAGSPAFVIYPKSRSAVDDGLWREVNLWEVPFAMAHEFGHHVLRTHTGVVNGLGVSSLLSHPTAPILPQNQQTDLQRTVTAADYWGAFNEAYADLFAYYVTGAVPANLSNLDCFRKSREVDSPVFGDGSAKVFNERVAAIFMSSERVPSDEDCNVPSLQGIHSIGAILAHAIDQMFLAAQITTPQARAEKLLEWAGELKKYVGQTSSPSMAGFIGSLRNVLLLTESADVSTKVCETARRIIPEIDQQLCNAE